MKHYQSFFFSYFDIGTVVKKYSRNTNGNFSIIFSLCLTVILAGAAVAVDISSLVSMKSRAQDNADIAALSAARYMSVTATSGLSFGQRKKEAESVANASLAAFLTSGRHNGGTVDVKVTADDVKISLAMKANPVLSQVIGRKNLNHSVVSAATIAQSISRDVDLALITDATGSMASTLTAVQTNMKDFTSDLTNELETRGITPGVVRIKFLFFRDYIFDNHQTWVDHKMPLQLGLEAYGALYSSDFYTLPGDALSMESYIDYFQPGGGGDTPENGLEAIWHAIDDNDWKSGSDTVRAMVLWTDAPNSSIGDVNDEFLGPDSFYSDITTDPTYLGWDQIIGSDFVAMDLSAREEYMYDNYYPKTFPSSMQGFKAIFDSFHNENANNASDVKTLTINRIGSDCSSSTPYDASDAARIASCGEWPLLDTWDGVEVVDAAAGISQIEIYDNIVKQVADTVEAQLVAKDLAIKY